jgi:hypothetical protein
VLVARAWRAKARLHLQIIDAGKSPSAESRKPAPLSSFSSQNVYDRDCDGLRGIGWHDQYTDQLILFAFFICAVGSRVRQKGAKDYLLQCSMITYQPFHCTKDVILLKQKAFEGRVPGYGY